MNVLVRGAIISRISWILVDLPLKKGYSALFVFGVSSSRTKIDLIIPVLIFVPPKYDQTMRTRCAHFWSYLEKTKIKTGITKSLLVRGPEGKDGRPGGALRGLQVDG